MPKIRFHRDYRVAHDGVKITTHKEGDVTEVPEHVANWVLGDKAGEVVDENDDLTVDLDEEETEEKEETETETETDSDEEMESPPKDKANLKKGAPENKKRR